MSTTIMSLARPVPVAWLFAVSFAFAALLGVMPNPLVGEGALFATDGAHNFVHLATAVGFVAVAVTGSTASIYFMRGFGVVYLLVGILGFAVLGGAPEGHLLGVVHINQMDNYLHVGLAALILAAGFRLPVAGDA